MRRAQRGAWRWLRRGLLALLGLAAILALAGPYEPVDATRLDFDPARLRGGVGAYVAAREARHPDIRPGNRMRVVWHGLEEVPTELAIVYLHGFAASAQDLRPVPQRVAEALRANLLLTRLTGHGRDGEALAQARAGDWIADTAEALAIGRAIGREVVVIGTSTGGTLAALAATDEAAMRDVKGIVFVSPNFAINAPWAALLNWPAARYWLPLLAGRSYSLPLRGAGQGRFWTATFPVTALLPVAALVRHVRRLDFGRARVPALFYYAREDRIVKARATDRVAAAWGGPVTLARAEPGPGIDPLAHVIAGDILSPAGTEPAVALILDWIGGLP